MIAVEIIPNLWIGDIRSIQDPLFLSKTRFTVIINCTTKYNFPDIKTINIRVPVRDRGINEDFELKVHLVSYDCICSLALAFEMFGNPLF